MNLNAELVTFHVLDPGGAAIPGVVVYVEARDRSLPASTGQAAINILQKDKGFAPYVGVVQAGTTVIFSNLDDITHHIYSVTGETRFSYTISAGEKTAEMIVDEPGLIAMGCNIHDWMSGYLMVLETPYFAFTDARGMAAFEVGEAGNYQVKAWHPQMQEDPRANLSLPGTARIILNLKRKMNAIPRQKGVDDFDFLEGY